MRFLKILIGAMMMSLTVPAAAQSEGGSERPAWRLVITGSVCS